MSTITKFWVNSMGEYGHTYDDGTETLAGTLNVAEVARQEGLSDALNVPQDVMNRAFERMLVNFVQNGGELSLYRAWAHLSDLGSSRWRFYASIDYTTPHRPTVYLIMSTEYAQDLSDKPFFARLNTIAESHGAFKNDDGSMPGDPHPFLEDMFTIDGTWQVAVNFDVYGKSYADVAKLQIDWLFDTGSVENALVNVI